MKMSRSGKGKFGEKKEVQRSSARAWAETDGEKNNDDVNKNKINRGWDWDGMCDTVDLFSLAVLLTLFVVFNGVYWSGAIRY